MSVDFQNHIIQNFSFLEEKKLLLATSGGLDSMVLLHLFQKLNYNIAIAHCNFQLRGIESNDDQKFIENYANANQICIFINKFETQNYAQSLKLSTQVAARELRYKWFYELCESENFDFILTAHHADDNLETFIINLSRGTGIDGLTGIPAKKKMLIRPLLMFSKNEIAQYATDNDLKWREDSSNLSNKYLRNKIRHKLIPILKDLNPKFLESLQKTQNYLQETQILANDAVNLIYKNVAQEIGNETYFNIKKIKELSNYRPYLYHFLNKYGFSAWPDIYNLIDTETGKQVFSSKYSLLRNRNFLILSSIQPDDTHEEYFIDEKFDLANLPLKLSIFKTTNNSNNSKKTIFVDSDKLNFPLVIKRWKEGVTFQPFGMNGQTKKVSKFFKDEKLSLTEKANIWILYSNNQIVWIIGMRQDERFKIETTTTNILQITLE